MKTIFLLIFPALLFATPKEQCEQFVTRQVEAFCKGKPPKTAVAIKNVFNPNRSVMVQRCINRFDEKIVSCGLKATDFKSFMGCDPQLKVVMVKFRKKVTAEQALAFLAKPKPGDSPKRKKCKQLTVNVLKMIRKRTGIPTIPDQKRFDKMVDECVVKTPVKRLDCQLKAKNSDQLKKCKGIK